MMNPIWSIKDYHKAWSSHAHLACHAKYVESWNQKALTCSYSGWSKFVLLIIWKEPYIGLHTTNERNGGGNKNEDMHYKRRDSFTIRSKGWKSGLTVPRDCIILWKSNVVYRNHVIDPATLSTLLCSWYSMTAWRSRHTTTSGRSNHGVSAGTLTQRLPWCGPRTKAGLLFCSKLFLKPFLLLQDKPDQRAYTIFFNNEMCGTYAMSGIGILN